MSLPRAHARRQAARCAALVAVAVAALVGCDENGPDGARVDGLAILSGDVGRTRLTAHDATDAAGREVAVPDPATAWISGAPGSVLVATLADGRLAVGNAAGDEDWRFIEPNEDAQPAGSLLFGAASPNGERVAALTLGAAGQFGVAVTEVASGASIVFPVEGNPVLTGPAWIDEERVGVVVEDPDVGGAISIAGVASGDVTGGPGNVRAAAVSADGSAVVWLSSVDGRLYGSNTSTWLAGQEIAALPVEPPRAEVRPGSFALDAGGTRLAVVWERDDGRVVEIAVHRRMADGWAVDARLGPPGDDPRAVVTWLR
ncbi:MAG TPA: hypothetical protein VFT20_02085 [Candidatus Limnocylindrales bacterium]|nr:hypothetical protein [Candidatus Limnocylindrales bacterium]